MVLADVVFERLPVDATACRSSTRIGAPTAMRSAGHIVIGIACPNDMARFLDRDAERALQDRSKKMTKMPPRGGLIDKLNNVEIFDTLREAQIVIAGI